MQDNDVYFFDRSRQKVLRFAGGQLFPISDKGAASLFEKETDKFNRSFSMDQGKIVSGYDPSDDQYFITFRPTSLALNYTLNENESGLEDVSESTNNSYSFALWFRMNEAMAASQQSNFTILSDYKHFSEPSPTLGVDTLFSTNLEISLGDGDPQLIFDHRLRPNIPIGQSNSTSFTLTADITTPDEWQHCCIVVDTSDQLIKMYLNGELVASASNDNTGFFPVEENNYNGIGGRADSDGTFLPYLDFDQTELRVGRRVGNYGGQLYPFIGEIDDISFFNEALTDLEVSTISGGGVYPDSVQAFFPFIQGTVSDAISGFFGIAIGSPELGSDRNGFAEGSFFFSGDESQYVSLPPFRQIIPREEQEVEIIEVEPDTIPPPTYSANQDNPYAGLTVSYDVSQSNGIWTSRHTFFPNLYSNQNNRMFSAINVVNTFVDSTALMFHKHADNSLKNNRSTFYAQPTAESFVRVVSNSSPSAVKVYDAISYEGDTAGFNVRIESSDGARTNIMNHFDKREDSYYINAGRDTTANSTSQITGIGNCIGVADLTGNIQMDSSLIGIPVMVGSVIKRYNADTQSLENIGTSPDEEVTVLDVLEDGVIQTSAVDASSAIGSPVVLITNSEIDGDSIRGHYALIKLSNTANNKYEVYCVNAHVTLSNLNHSR